MGAASWLTAQPYAHRGLHDAANPENTLGAFRAGFARGYGVELDVRLSKDGRAVVVHDEALERLTGSTASVSELTVPELAALRVGGSEWGIPTLADVLAEGRGHAPILIELKNAGLKIGPLEGAVARDMAAGPHNAAVMSWNGLSVLWFYRHAPHLVRGLVVTSIPRGFTFSGNLLLNLINCLPIARMAAADFLAYDLQVLPTRLSRRFQRRGLPVLTWTVRTQSDHAKAAQFADAPIFEKSDIENG